MLLSHRTKLLFIESFFCVYLSVPPEEGGGGGGGRVEMEENSLAPSRADRTGRAGASKGVKGVLVRP